MKIRGKFLALFAAQALAAAVVSVLFAFGAIIGEDAKAEAELGPIPREAAVSANRAMDSSLPEAERLVSALKYAEVLRAQVAAARVYRSQSAIEAAIRIGGFSLVWASLAALAFALVSRGFTRRLDELAAGAVRVSTDRSFRLPAVPGREFGPVFMAVNVMLDRLAEQESMLGEAAKLEGWKEVSSFLFHQLRTPLSSIELASRNVSLVAGREKRDPSGSSPEARALAACAASAESALAECTRVRALLDRFKSLSGLALAAPEPVDPAELASGLASRIAPHRARVVFSGERAPMFVDRRMVEEAVLNLVVNASEACAQLPALVRIESSHRADFAFLEISDDNGPVDPGLFERSGRQRFSTKPEGTGLGLLFVRRVAAMHGGGFEVFAGADGGFRARLILPLAADSGERGPSG